MFVTQGLSRSYSHAAQVPSSNVTYRSPRNPWMNWRIVLAFASRIDSMDQLPRGIQHRDGNRCRVHIHTDIFKAIHRGRSFLSELRKRSKVTTKGRPFILAKKFRATGLAERFF